ncbi:MAG: hypothetical protein VW338_08115 [Rhodospirillaceae bacterium]
MTAKQWREQDPDDIAAALAAAAGDAATGWSLGTFGALAEFHRGPADAAEVSSDGGGWRVATVAGLLQVERHAEARLLPYEMLSKLPTAWSQSVLICLPQAAADIGGAAGLSEVGVEAGGTLFDIGLGVSYLKPCVRTADSALKRLLRRHAGTPFLALPHDAVAAIKHAQPARIFISALGRIEVTAEIPAQGGSTPLGPHTHLMPELLAKKRGQSANISVPRGWVSALAFYPPNPARDILGELKSFDGAAHARFQDLIARFAPAKTTAAKRLALDALAAGRGPDAAALPKSRAERTALRVALRQFYHTHGETSAWRRWTEACDPMAARSLAAD